MLRRALGVLAIASVLVAVPASAAITVVVENFNKKSLWAGAAISPTGPSERWLNTNYYQINSVNGWTFTGGAMWASSTVPSYVPNDGALVLGNVGGNGTAKLTLTGLTAGITYHLFYHVWGVNAGQQFRLDADVDGYSGGATGTTGAPGSDKIGDYIGIDFVASGSTADLTFARSSLSNTAPIIDKVWLRSVPEPSSWIMMIGGFGLLGASVRRQNAKRPASA